MVDQGHYGWALSWGVLVVRTTCPVLSDNKLKEKSEQNMQQDTELQLHSYF